MKKVKFLFHLHTKYSSDGSLTPQGIVDYCRRNKIDVVAITDHNEIAGARETAKLANGDPLVIIGEEIKTDCGEIIGLFLTKKIAKYTPIKKAINAIKVQGGIVVLPHPSDNIRRSTIKSKTVSDIIKEVDAVETLNSRSLIWSANKQAGNLAAKHKKPVLAGADAHLSFELNKAINILPDFNDGQSFLRALKKNQLLSKRSGILLQSISIFVRLMRKFALRKKK